MGKFILILVALACARERLFHLNDFFVKDMLKKVPHMCFYINAVCLL